MKVDWAWTVHVRACCGWIALVWNVNMRRVLAINLNSSQASPTSSSVETGAGSVADSTLSPRESWQREQESQISPTGAVVRVVLRLQHPDSLRRLCDRSRFPLRHRWF